MSSSITRVTGAGVTAGIDFALTLCSEILGEARTRMVQLALEYDPAQPFDSGSPTSPDGKLVERLRSLSTDFIEEQNAASVKAAAALGA